MKSKRKITLFGVRMELPLVRLGIIMCSALLAGALYSLWPKDALGSFIEKSVFYFSLAGSGFAFYYLGRLAKTGLSQTKAQNVLLAVLPALLGSAIIFLHADFGFKVSMDEEILSASAKSLYEDQVYHVGVHGEQGADGFEVTAGYLDKRPWLYSFSVSILHTLSGWRVANAYVVNALSGIAFVFVICAFGRRLGGAPGAWVGVLLAASIPLVAQCSTGGGMDLLNATLLASLFLLGTKYLEGPSEVGEGALISIAILLTYSRYESLLYVAPVLLVVGLGWYLKGRIFLSLPALLLAPLLLPVFIQNRYFRESAMLWEFQNPTQSSFGFEHVGENFPRAIYFFFNLSDALPNSAVVSILGLSSMVVILVWSVRYLPRRWHQHQALLCWGVFTATVIINFIILMAYYEGKLDRIFGSRLSLPMQLGLIWAPCAVLGIWESSRRGYRLLITVITVYILVWTLPANGRELFTQRNYVQNELNWLREVVAPDVLRNDLVIDQNSIGWTLHEKQALRPRAALKRIDWLAAQQESGAIENIYYVERMEYSVSEGELSLESSRLPQGVFDLQPLLQKSFRPFSKLRLYRVSEIHADSLPKGFLDRLPHGKRQDYDYNGL